MTAYVFFGKNGQTKTQNIQNRHSRAVKAYCDTSIKDFLNDAKRIQAKGRKVGCIGIVQSFDSNEFDYKDSDDAQAVNDLGWELANKLYPNSKCLVVTHNDGKGHKLHNHIQVLNEDMTTGRAIESNRQLYKMRAVNDELMQEHGLAVIKPQKGLIKKPRNDFQRQLQKDLQSILTSKDAPTTFDSYLKACEARGINVKQDVKHAKKDGEDVEVMGLTYRRKSARKKPDYYNPDRTEVRVRRAKASTLGEMFTFNGVQEQFEIIKQRQDTERRKKREKAKPKRKKIQISYLNVGSSDPYVAHAPKQPVKAESEPKEKPERKKIQISYLDVGGSDPYVAHRAEKPAEIKSKPDEKHKHMIKSQPIKKAQKPQNKPKKFIPQTIPVPWETNQPVNNDDDFEF